MDKQQKKVPEVGMVYHHRYKGVMYEMTVVRAGDSVGFDVGGVIYNSPTAAAKAIVGKDQFVNGRKFWHLDD
jgi:hypothetical protein